MQNINSTEIKPTHVTAEKMWCLINHIFSNKFSILYKIWLSTDGVKPSVFN